MSFFQQHAKAIIGAITALAGLSTLLNNEKFVALLGQIAPHAIAVEIVSVGSLVAIVAGWVLALLNPSPMEK